MCYSAAPMTTIVVLGALVVVTLGLSVGWDTLRKQTETKARGVAQDVAALGEVVPVSIHPHIDLDRCIGSGACVNACPEHDVLGIVDGKAHLLNPLACIGHSACAAACPVDAISLVFGTSTRGVELPALKPTFETSLPGVYIAGELGGMGLIRNALEQGRQAAESVLTSGRRGRGNTLDAIVVGSGPAGIAATLALREKKLKVLLLEAEAYGGTIRHYPRGKVVMTGPLFLPGYGKIRKRTMSKEQLCRLWDDIREKTDLPVVTGELVTGIENAGDSWKVRSATGGEHRAANVVLALGRRGSPRKLEVPGEDHPKVSYRLLEPEPFQGKHVLIVGGGNSAAECAIALGDFAGCKSVTLSYRREELARLRGDVKRRIEQLFKSKRVAAALPSTVKEIKDRTVVLANGPNKKEIPNDAIIVQIGGTSPNELLNSMGIRTVLKYGEA